MSGFAVRNPYFILVVCLFIAVVGVSSLARMPVDMFPTMNIPVVVVATFYSGMPPEQIETDITSRFERFFTLGSGIEHIESRSLPGVSIIKVYFQPGTNPDSAVTTISNLAMAQLRRLPPGTLPPVVLKFDASSLPVCLVTFKGEGLNETRLRDLAQFTVRNQIANVPGASVPQPFGGKYRQIMIYADPFKLEAHQLSLMDVVRAVNDSNLILPAGDVRIGAFDYNIYTNSQLPDIATINTLPVKTVNQAAVTVADIGQAKDAQQIQTNVVRVDGQRSVYLPVLKQGGDTNTIAVVDGVKGSVAQLSDTPRELITRVVFDQSQFVKTAIETLLHEGAIGLFLTSLMILIFLGSMRATVAVFFSIPLSALATFLMLAAGGGSVNSMVLGGLALAFSRLIDNSVVVLENIYRHLEMGATPRDAAIKGGSEVALPVLAATLTTVVVFFPVTFLYGVSKFLFTALASAVVLSLFASYAVAMTVVPLFCALFIKGHHQHPEQGVELDAENEVAAEHSAPQLAAHAAPRRSSLGQRFNAWFNRGFDSMLNGYDRMVNAVLAAPAVTVTLLLATFVVSLAIFPWLGLSFFPRTDAGQFVINLKAPSGTRLEITESLVGQVEKLVREVVSPEDLGMIVSNIGSTPDFSAIYTSNSAQHTAFVQVSLKDDHRTGSYEYMARVRTKLERELPQMSAYFQSGGLVDAVLNLGLPAPIDVQVSGSKLERSYNVAAALAQKIRGLPGVSDVFIPQDLDYPALQLDVDRTRAGQLGLNQREVVGNVITALTSNQMIAPSFWIDPKTGNDYMLTVQYPESQVRSLTDLQAIPIRSAQQKFPARLDVISKVSRIESPTEVDHYQLRRTIDIFVRPSGEDLGKLADGIDGLIRGTRIPEGVKVDLRGMVQGMRASFKSFTLGLALAVVLLYLILVAQFRSFIDPFLILLAVPSGLTGVLLTLWLTDTTLNVMSLMGVVMLVGIVVSNSILIVEFTHRLQDQGIAVKEAVALACRVRLRPVLMTSLATIIGLMPMAAKLGAGSESYAPLARAIIGGLTASVLVTVFIVPAAYLLVYRRRGLGVGALGLGLCGVLLMGGAAPASAQTPVKLTLTEAQGIAVKNHPAVSAALLTALAANQVPIEVRSALYPTLTGSVTAAGALDGSRIAAGALNNPVIYNRVATGFTISQVLTDFGRTANLTESAKQRAQAQQDNAQTTRAQVLLQVNRAYFSALRAQNVLTVARQTVAARQIVADQVHALAESKLKSGLDVSFANVNLSEAKLLLASAENDREAAMAELASALGYNGPQNFVLEDAPAPPELTEGLPALTAAALQQRPEMATVHAEEAAAASLVKAERALAYPTVSALAAVGVIPAHEDTLRGRYGALGFNLSIPVFNGHLFSARRSEAEYKAQATTQAGREVENRIARDVQVALLNANTAKQRLGLTAELLGDATQALDLAQTRYDLGLSSIVELSQAQLQKTSAEIAAASARYDYALQRAVLSYQVGNLK